MLRGVNVKGAVDVAASGDTPEAFHVPVQAVAVRVRPQAAFAVLLPRQRPQHLAAPCELIERELALQERIAVKDNEHIVNGALDLAVLRALQLFSPCGVVLRRGIVAHALELPHSLFVLFAVECGAYGLVGQRQIAHSLVGRELCNGRFRRSIVVLVSELV